MKLIGLAGAMLILVGGASLALGGFSYITQQPVLAMGPLTASVAERHLVSIPEMFGFGLIAIGGIFILLNYRGG